MTKDYKKSPGYKLREVLEEIFPYQPQNSNFIFKIDRSINADENFALLSYYSSLNYLIRRLIVGADFIKRKYNIEGLPAEKYLGEIKKYIYTTYNFPPTKVEDIYDLIVESVTERNRKLSQAKKDAVLKAGKSRDLGCYICGKELIYDKRGYPENHPDIAEVEHLWPKSLGGSNELFNLEVCCFQCNKGKANHIDVADYHYEKFFVIKDRSDVDFFSDFHRSFIVASHLRNDCKCIRCNKLAIHQNRLYLNRRDSSEGWHMLNIDSYCSKHITSSNDSI